MKLEIRKYIDLPLLQQRTRILQKMLSELSSKEPLAASCLEGLQPTFEEIMRGEISKPYKEIPYGNYFHFDRLRSYDGLETAYSNFVTTATGINDEDVHKLMAEIREQRINSKTLR